MLMTIDTFERQHGGCECTEFQSTRLAWFDRVCIALACSDSRWLMWAQWTRQTMS